MFRFRSLFVGTGLALVVVIVSACASSTSAKADRLCTANNFVYCRCADLAEGTKQCNAEATAFSACDCGQGAGIPPDDGLGDTSLDPIVSPPMKGAQIPAACIGKLGLVAGQEMGMDAFVATYSEAGKFMVSVSRGPGLRSPVSIATAGDSIVATYLSRYSLLAWTKFEQGNWSPPVSIGLAQAASKPSLVPSKETPPELTLFYKGLDSKYYVGKYANGWDDATTIAESPMGESVVVPGKSAPSGTISNGVLAYAFSGTDGSANFATFDGMAWGPAQRVDVRAAPFAPTLIGLAGRRNLLAVFTGADLALHSIAHDGETRKLEAPILVDSAAVAQDPVNMATMRDGRVMMLYRGTNQKPYFATFDTALAKWSTPQELLPGKNPEVAWTPSVTLGRCGSEATAAYAEANGKVKVVRYVAGKWEGPFDVAGIESATYVGVAELP